MLGEFWPHVGPALLKGQMAADQTLKEALEVLSKGIMAVQEGRMQLWAVIDDAAKRVLAAMVTEIIVDDDGSKVVWVTGMGGEGIGRWGKQLSDRMAEFARSEDCTHVRFVGRKALQRTYSGVRIVGERDPGVYVYERRTAS
jgi:hypothetical protein